MKTTRKVMVHRAMHAIVCVKCGAYLATASEKRLLPKFVSHCDCKLK